MEARELPGGQVYLLRLPGGGTWRELLERVGSFAEARALGRPGLTGALLDREKAFPTGVAASMGVAIPHTDERYTARPGVVVAVLEEPTVFRAMDGEETPVPVEILLLLLKDAKHLELLGATATLIRDRDRLATLKSPAAMSTLAAAFGPVLE